jgi:hypothetical protein
MDKARLMEVLNDSTCLISKGERTQRKLPGIPVLLWGLLLSASDASAQDFNLVDCHFVTVAVNPVQAEAHRQGFIELLESFPDLKRLQDGPSYKHVASVVGDEVTALRVFGLGQTLGLWDVLLPDQFGVDQDSIDEAADLGLIVTTGYAGTLSQPVQHAVG